MDDNFNPLDSRGAMRDRTPRPSAPDSPRAASSPSGPADAAKTPPSGPTVPKRAPGSTPGSIPAVKRAPGGTPDAGGVPGGTPDVGGIPGGIGALGTTPAGTPSAPEKAPGVTAFTYENTHISKIRDAAGRMLETPAEVVRKNADFTADDRTDDYTRLQTRAGQLRTIGSAVGDAGAQGDALAGLRMSSRRFTAGDIFVGQHGEFTAYVNDLSACGIQSGLSVGVIRTYDAVFRQPEDFLAETGVFDGKKLATYAKEHERYVDEKTKAVFRPTGKVYRKKAARIQAMKAANTTEVLMRGRIGKGIFSSEEEKILRENNRMFRFQNRWDLLQTDAMVDKYLLDVWKRLAPDAQKQTITASNAIGLHGDPTLVKIGHMRTRDIKGLLRKVGEVPGAEEFRDALKLKLAMSETKEKFRHSGGAVSAAVGLMGGSELAQSEFGQSVGYARRGAHVAQTTVRIARDTGKLAWRADVKVADLVAPDLTRNAREVDEAVRKAMAAEKEKAARKAAATVRTAAGKIPGVRQASALARRMAESYRKTRIHAAAAVARKYGGAALSRAGRVIAKPFGLMNSAGRTVKRTVLVPGALLMGGILAIAAVMMLFGGGNGNGGGAWVIVLSEKEDFDAYQAKYDQLEERFKSQIDSVINAPASTRDLKGREIHYGVNVAAENAGSVAIPEQYRNGVSMNYLYNGNSAAGISSNIADCISAMAVIMQQDQSAHKEEALELLEALYQSSHAYTTLESPLYPCNSGDEIVHYYCYDKAAGYANSDLKYHPWLYKPANTIAGSSYDHSADGTTDAWPNGMLEEPKGECPVCKALYPDDPSQYAGCEVLRDESGKPVLHYHGNESVLDGAGNTSTDVDNYSGVIWWSEKDSDKDYTEYYRPRIVTRYTGRYAATGGYDDDGNLRQVLKSDILSAAGIDPASCDNYDIITLHTTQTYENDKGKERSVQTECAYVAVCKGHEHYYCPGHDIAACFGHVDLTMTVNVASVIRMFDFGGVPVDESKASMTEEEMKELGGASESTEAETEAETPESTEGGEG